MKNSTYPDQNPKLNSLTYPEKEIQMQYSYLFKNNSKLPIQKKKSQIKCFHVSRKNPNNTVTFPKIISSWNTFTYSEKKIPNEIPLTID